MMTVQTCPPTRPWTVDEVPIGLEVKTPDGKYQNTVVKAYTHVVPKGYLFAGEHIPVVCLNSGYEIPTFVLLRDYVTLDNKPCGHVNTL